MMKKWHIAFALLALAGGGAQAADCEKGYLTLGNDVTVACREESGASESTEAAPSTDQPEEPATTGSITAPATPDQPNQMRQAKSIEDCKPGQFYMMKGTDYTTPMMCR